MKWHAAPSAGAMSSTRRRCSRHTTQPPPSQASWTLRRTFQRINTPCSPRWDSTTAPELCVSQRSRSSPRPPAPMPPSTSHGGTRRPRSVPGSRSVRHRAEPERRPPVVRCGAGFDGHLVRPALPLRPMTPSRQDEDMKTTYDERKFTELLVHVAGRLQSDRSGGATKLDKVIFFADFAHVRRTGSPITGATYQKLEHGPAARRLRPVRDELISKGEAELREEEFLGYQQHRLVPRREADLTVFTAGRARHDRQSPDRSRWPQRSPGQRPLARGGRLAPGRLRR